MRFIYVHVFSYWQGYLLYVFSILVDVSCDVSVTPVDIV